MATPRYEEGTDRGKVAGSREYTTLRQQTGNVHDSENPETYRNCTPAGDSYGGDGEDNY